MTSAVTATMDTGNHTNDIEHRISEIINRIRPAAQEDGGDIEFVGFDESGMVRVRLHGACVGCPSSALTLRLGVEQTLRDAIPEVRGVVCV